MLNPVFWLLFLLLWARLTKKSGRRKKLVLLCLLGCLVLTNPFLVRVAYRVWEISPVEIASLSEQKYEGAIVLGGFEGENEVFGNQFQFSESANRLPQALELYRLG